MTQFKRNESIRPVVPVSMISCTYSCCDDYGDYDDRGMGSKEMMMREKRPGDGDEIHSRKMILLLQDDDQKQNLLQMRMGHVERGDDERNGDDYHYQRRHKPTVYSCDGEEERATFLSVAYCCFSLFLSMRRWHMMRKMWRERDFYP